MNNNETQNPLSEDISFFRRLAEFRQNGDTVSPDSFNEVARELYGMSITEAQMLHTRYRRIMAGAWNWDGKEGEKAIDVLTKAKSVVDHAMMLVPSDTWRSIKSYMDYDNYGNRNRIGVWARFNGGEPQLFEYFLNSPKHLAMISDMEKREDVEILCIVPWVDTINHLEDCENNVGDKSCMFVYDGDIFVLSNRGTDNYWNKPSENGVYVCLDGAYRRLLYTVGRGYLTVKNEANVASEKDEDDPYGDVFCFDENRWNHHLLTLEHKWRRIGNIHVDITLLQEKKP